MTIGIKFFATFRDVAGTGDLTLRVADAATVADVVEQLEQHYPQFNGQLTNMALVAVNESYTHRKKELQADDMVAFFPPVSGG